MRVPKVPPDLHYDGDYNYGMAPKVASDLNYMVIRNPKAKGIHDALP